MPIFGVGTLLGNPGSATNIDLQMSMAAQDGLMFSLIFVSDSCRKWCGKRALKCECEASCLTRTPSFCCHDFKTSCPGLVAKGICARFICTGCICVGPGDPVRVLRLFHNQYTGYNWSIYCWDYVQLITAASGQVSLPTAPGALTELKLFRTVLYGGLNGCWCRR